MKNIKKIKIRVKIGKSTFGYALPYVMEGVFFLFFIFYGGKFRDSGGSI